VLATTPTLSNIDYLFTGYNVFYGNPHSTDTFDPGFANNKIFQATYTQEALSADQRYLVPDFVDVKQETQCDIQYTSTTITGETSLTNSLTEDVSFELSGFGASFKASTSYS
jgi:hypothetical protein